MQRNRVLTEAVDVDHFKAINDTHGHPAGDEVLRALAARFSGRLRSIDIVGRWGGEEFLAVLPDAGPLQGARGAAALHGAGLSEPVLIDELSVTVSVGWAYGSGLTADRLVELADSALYRAKAGGRNCVRRHSP